MRLTAHLIAFTISTGTGCHSSDGLLQERDVQPEEAIVQPRSIPGGVAGPDGAIGYIEGADGRLESIDLSSGRVRWSVESELRPLLATSEWVAVIEASAKSVQQRAVLLLSSADGAQQLRSEPVMLPDWLLPADAPSQTFEEEVTLEGRTLRYAWHARARYAGGAPPPPEVEAQYAREEAGVAWIDLETGAVRNERRRVEADAPEAVVGGDAPPFAYWYRGRLRTDPIRLGDTLLLPTRKKGLVLRQRDMHSPEREAETILETPATELYVTTDRSALIVQDEERWSVISLPGGEVIARLSIDLAARDFALIANQLLYATERAQGGELTRTLHAVTLDDGRRAWSRALRSSSVPPPPPP